MNFNQIQRECNLHFCLIIIIIIIIIIILQQNIFCISLSLSIWIFKICLSLCCDFLASLMQRKCSCQVDLANVDDAEIAVCGLLWDASRSQGLQLGLTCVDVVLVYVEFTILFCLDGFAIRACVTICILVCKTKNERYDILLK